MTRARDSGKVRVKAMVRTTVERLAATGVTGRGLVTIICSATASATKAATRTNSAMDLETSMVAAAVTTKEGASATDRVKVIIKATNGIPRSAYGCSIERETRATDTEAIQRTGPRVLVCTTASLHLIGRRNIDIKF